MDCKTFEFLERIEGCYCFTLNLEDWKPFIEPV